MTIAGLAGQEGVPYSKAVLIVRGMGPRVHVSKSGQLSAFDKERVRRAFVQSRLDSFVPGLGPEEVPMEDLNIKIIPAVREERTMDSREIAELTGKRHDHVMTDISEQLGKLGGLPKFRDTYRNAQNGQIYPCYKLPYRETMILVSGYSVELRARVIDRWMELERAEAKPATPKGSELLALAVIEAQRMIEEKDKALALAAPKVESFDRFLSADGTLCLQDAGKHLGKNPNKFIKEMAERGLLFRRGGTWIAKQDYLDRGWFVVRSMTSSSTGRLCEQTRVTPKGLEGLARTFPAEAARA